jgi:UDP-hydrolysing UDP-N-acetyl-D-glucosamine 2-epimerase
MKARRIALVTGSRADWGLLSGLAHRLAADPRFDLRIVASGAHLDRKMGKTLAEIDLPIAARVPAPQKDDGRRAAAQATGKALAGFAEAFARLAPGMVVLLGDRFEIFAAAAAATLLGVPIAHIHGGELTLGALDDALRHAITKMAHLHFTAAQPYAKRVIQMGESPKRVFVTGAPGVDAIAATDFPDAASLGGDLGLALHHPLFLVTYHPVTQRKDDEAKAVAALLAALDRFPKARIVITGVNADPGRERIARRLAAYARKHASRVTLHASLGQRRYLGVLALADAVIGNSSSGLIEAPALGVPTVDIGSRQGGRLRARSVIGAAEDPQAIARAIVRALDPAFRVRLRRQTPPYGRPGAAKRMHAILAAADWSTLSPKPFHDLRPSR